MLDLSEEPLHENIEICKRYLERMGKLGMTLEIELGVTGGEEDGVDNTGVSSSRLYTQPEEVAYAYDELSKVSPRFTIAAAFGNVHGVYKPGNVKLRPDILHNCQVYVQQKYGTAERPLNLVFHGGSGSTPEEIHAAVSYGVVKMNIDTDLQWALWEGDQELLPQERRLPAGADRQPQRPRRAQQEILRPARLAARRRGKLQSPPAPLLRRARRSDKTIYHEGHKVHKGF